MNISETYSSHAPYETFLSTRDRIAVSQQDRETYHNNGMVSQAHNKEHGLVTTDKSTSSWSFNIISLGPDLVEEKPSELKFTDGSQRKVTRLDVSPALEAHYQSGKIVEFQKTLETKGSREVDEVYTVGDRIVGAKMGDVYEWFDEKVRDVVLKDSSAPGVDALKDKYGEQVQVSEPQAEEGRFSDLYREVFGSDFSDFVSEQVNGYRIAAERYFQSTAATKTG